MPDNLADGSLLIEDRNIVKIIALEANLPPAESIIDLTGLTLFPAFIDLHIHGASGVDVMNATAADLNQVSTFLASKGVSSWLPTLVPAPASHYERAVGSVRERMGPDIGASVPGVHYKGPYLNHSQYGALHHENFNTYSSPEDIDALPLVNSKSAIHMATVAPEIDGGVELIRELQSRNWIVSLGHTRARIDVLEQARDAGARHMTHFMNAMAPLHHRNPGPIGWGLAHDDVTLDFIADGVHLDPFMLRLLMKLKGARRLSLISDAIAAAGLGDGQYGIWGETITVKEGRTANAQGTIAGSVITMLDAVRMMLSLGASEVEVAQMASTNPAKLLSIDGERGSIEVGKRADLVALDSDGQVRLTIIGGVIAYQP